MMFESCRSWRSLVAATGCSGTMSPPPPRRPRGGGGGPRGEGGGGGARGGPPPPPPPPPPAPRPRGGGEPLAERYLGLWRAAHSIIFTAADSCFVMLCQTAGNAYYKPMDKH
jgi:hypothetical protein